MPTALEYIHAIAEELGEFAEGVTSSVGTTSTLVFDDYVNSNMQATGLAEYGVLIEDGACAGEVGWVTKAGLARATGTITTADTFSSAIASGVTFSLYGRLPAARKGLQPGLLQIVNRVLRRTPVESTISIPGVTDQQHYTMDLSLYPWASDDTRIIDVQYPVTDAADIPRAMPRSMWDWVSDGETRRLRFHGAPFRTGETFTIKVYRPANSRLRLNATGRAALSTTTVGSITAITGGYYTSAPTVTISGGGGSGAAATAVLATTPGPVTSYTVTNAGTGYTSVPTVTVAAGAWSDQTSQTAGLVSITDEAIPDVHDVFVMGMALSYRALAAMEAPGATVAEWLTKGATWEQTAARLKLTRIPRDDSTNVIGARAGHASFASRRY